MAEPKKYLPLKMTVAQTQELQTRLHADLDGLAEACAVTHGLDAGVVKLELAIICARYAVNAGVLDATRVPPNESHHADPTPTLVNPTATTAGPGSTAGAGG